jgi:hypothetical protein
MAAREHRRTICLLGLDEPLERVVTHQLRHDGFCIVHGDSVTGAAAEEPAPAAVILDVDAFAPEEWPEELAGLLHYRERGALLVLATDRIPPRRERLLGGAAILYKPFTLGMLRQQLAACLNA